MSAKTANKPFSTRLPDDVRAALQAMAQSKGLKEGDLGRMFIIEKLAESQAGIASLSAELRTLAALIIAALSESIVIEDARELVAQQLQLLPSVSS